MDDMERTGRITTLKPNWQSEFKIDYEFKTSIITHYDGTEQREAIRQTPRVEISYAALLHGDALTTYVRDLRQGMVEPFVVPLKWQYTTLVLDSVAANRDMRTADVPGWLVAGAWVVVEDGSREEVVQIESVFIGVSNVIRTVGVLSADLAAGSKVYRAYQAYAQPEVGMTHPNTRAAVTSVQWRVVPGSDPAGQQAATPDTFEGVEVFAETPNWRDDVSLSIMQIQQDLDHGYGRDFVESVVPGVRTVETLIFTCFDADRLDRLVAFFHRMKGRRGEFWSPTWLNDIVVSEDRPAGQKVLIVDGAQFLETHYADPIYSVVYVRHNDGTVQMNRMDGMVVVDGETRIAFKDNWTAEVTPSTRISFMPLWRFAADKIEVNWLTTQRAEVNFAFQTLPNEAP